MNRVAIRRVLPKLCLGVVLGLTAGLAHSAQWYVTYTKSHKKYRVPFPFPQAKQILAGLDYVMVLDADGTVYSWGKNSRGQLGVGDTLPRTAPTPVIGMTDVVAMSGDFQTTLFLKRDGTVWGCGDESRVIPNFVVGKVPTPIQIPGLSDIVQISFRGSSACALRSDGTVFGWGFQVYYRAGGPTAVVTVPELIPGLSGITKIARGEYNLAALRNDGRVLISGYGGIELNDSPASDPVVVPSLRDIVDISAGRIHETVLHRSGYVYSWGYNANGQLGRNLVVESVYTPTKVPLLSNIVKLSGGREVSVALDDKGRAYGWGDNFLHGLLCYTSEYPWGIAPPELIPGVWHVTDAVAPPPSYDSSVPFSGAYFYGDLAPVFSLSSPAQQYGGLGINVKLKSDVPVPQGGVDLALKVDVPAAHRAEVTVPSTLSFPAGAKEVVVPITVAPTASRYNFTLNISSLVGNYRTTITVLPPAIAELTPQLTSVYSGDPVHLSVRLTSPSPAGLTLGVPPSAYFAPGTDLVMPAGETEATFDLNTLPQVAHTGARIPVLDKSAFVQIYRTATKSAALEPRWIKGGGPVDLVVNLLGSAPEGMTLQLESTDAALLPVPPTLVVPKNARSVRLSLNAKRPSVTTYLQVRVTYLGRTRIAELRLKP